MEATRTAYHAARVQRTLVHPPSSRLGAIAEDERRSVIARSPVTGVYDRTIDRESAYEALQGKGRVIVRATPARLESGGTGRDAVLVEVADDGPGIPAEAKDKVFDLFFTTKAKGSGLGLAVVRRIVDAHDGRLDLHTSPKGTTIRVTLPVVGGDDTDR